MNVAFMTRDLRYVEIGYIVEYIIWEKKMSECLDEIGECWMHWIRGRDEHLWWVWYLNLREKK